MPFLPINKPLQPGPNLELVSGSAYINTENLRYILSFHFLSIIPFQLFPFPVNIFLENNYSEKIDNRVVILSLKNQA